MSSPLSNPKWEKFARLVAAGVPPVDAYGRVGYAAWNAAVAAPRFLQNPEIAQRIQDLQSESDSAPGIMSRESLLVLLSQIVRGRSVTPEQMRALELMVRVRAMSASYFPSGVEEP